MEDIKKSRLALGLLLIVISAGLTYAVMHRKESTEASKYYSNSFEINSFRVSRDGVLAPTAQASFQDLKNGWIQFANPEEKYLVEIPDNVYDDVFVSVPTAVFQVSTSQSYIAPAYRAQYPWTLLDVKIPKDTDRVKVLNSYSDLVANDSKSLALQTYDVSSDADILSSAKDYFGSGCNFTAVSKKPSTQSGTDDITLTASNPNTEACSRFISPLSEDMKAHDYVPEVVKYSSVARKVMFIQGNQGCRWTLPDDQGTCADEHVFDSIKFDQQ